MAHAAKASAAQRAAVNSTVQELMSVIQKRRSVRVYKTGKVSDAQLEYGPRGGALGALGSEHATLGVRRDAEPQENEAHPQRFTITSGGKENAKTPSITRAQERLRRRCQRYRSCLRRSANQSGLPNDSPTSRPRETFSGKHRQRRPTNDAGRREHESRHRVGFRA